MFTGNTLTKHCGGVSTYTLYTSAFQLLSPSSLFLLSLLFTFLLFSLPSVSFYYFALAFPIYRLETVGVLNETNGLWCNYMVFISDTENSAISYCHNFMCILCSFCFGGNHTKVIMEAFFVLWGSCCSTPLSAATWLYIGHHHHHRRHNRHCPITSSVTIITTVSTTTSTPTPSSPPPVSHFLVTTTITTTKFHPSG